MDWTYSHIWLFRVLRFICLLFAAFNLDSQIAPLCSWPKQQCCRLLKSLRAHVGHFTTQILCETEHVINQGAGGGRDDCFVLCADFSVTFVQQWSPSLTRMAFFTHKHCRSQSKLHYQLDAVWLRVLTWKTPSYKGLYISHSTEL